MSTLDERCETRQCTDVATLVRIVLCWIACYFVSMFARTIIIGMVSLTAEQVIILDNVISTVVGVFWLVVSGVHIFKVYKMYNPKR